MAQAKPIPEDTYLNGGLRHKQLASQRNSRWSVIVPEGHTREQFMDPLYWRVHAVDMRVNDIVVITDEPETFWGEYLVFEKGRDYAKLQELRHVELGTGLTSPDNADYQYKWKGSTKRHCVIRAQDNSVIMSDMPSKQAAVDWIETQKKRNAA